MGEGPESEQPGKGSANVVYRGYRARRETAQLGNHDKITAEAQSQNRESGGQKRTAHDTNMETRSDSDESPATQGPGVEGEKTENNRAAHSFEECMRLITLSLSLSCVCGHMCGWSTAV